MHNLTQEQGFCEPIENPYGDRVELRILVWNAERKSARGSVGRRIPTLLARHDPDIVLLTEGEVGLLPPDGHTITARPLPEPYLRPPERRVLAWSRSPWDEVEDYGELESVPSDEPASCLCGRIVSGTTSTPFGPLLVHAVCIPWSFAGVRWSEIKRRPCEEHLMFLEALDLIIAARPPEIPTIVGGDFNQVVPRAAGAPHHPAERLASTFAPPWSIVTAGVTAATPSGEQPLIDHLAIDDRLVATSVDGFANHDFDGQRLSDHTGVVVTVQRH